MFSKDMVEQILEGIVWLNTKIGIWAFIIPIVFAVAVLYQLFQCYKKPSVKNSRIIMGIFAVIYLFSGYSIYIGKDFMGQNALIGGIGLWVVSVLLVFDVFFNWTEIRLNEKNGLKYISLFLIFSGIFLYPLIEIALGFTFPKMVFFGAECPTTISLIGIFIGSIPRVNKPLFVLVSINAIYTGLSVAIYGAAFDYLYALAGFIGVLLMIIYFKDIFLTKKITKNAMSE